MTRVAVRELSVPTFDPFVIASGAVEATRSVLVDVELVRHRDGRRSRGVGEGACLPPVTVEDQADALGAVRAAAPKLQAQRFDAFDACSALLDAALGPTPVARSAVEVAVLDAWARLDDAPLFAWVSGRPLGPAIETDITIPILAPGRMAELAAQWWAKGFRALKVKVGRDLDADLRALEAMVRAAPGARFRPDANAGLTVDEALAYITQATRLGAHVECFEQPCATLAELAEVARAIEAPVLADESVKTLADFEALVEARAADGVNLKIAKSGGWLRAYDIGRAANARGMPLMVGGMVETRLGMTAATHLAAALGGVAFADLDTAWLLTSDPFTGGYQGASAHYELPTTPGLGVAERS